MRAREFLNEAPESSDRAWQALQQIRAQSVQTGKRLAQHLQLFVPRPRLSEQHKLSDFRPESEVLEAAPVLVPGQVQSPPGRNKPSAAFWTSSAEKRPDGTYISDWSRWTADNMPGWSNTQGHLYKIRSGARVLDLHSATDAKSIYNIFQDLGVIPDLSDTEAYKRFPQDSMALSTHFPWDQVSKHFDGVWYDGGNYHDEFMYGWDVESTAWFNAAVLDYRGQCEVFRPDLDDDDY